MPVGEDALRAKVVDDFAHFGNEHAMAAFTSFDCRDSSEVVVTCPRKLQSARVLPTSAAIAGFVRVFEPNNGRLS